MTESLYLSGFYHLAAVAHDSIHQKRDDGAPFINHPIMVANEVAAAIADLHNEFLLPYTKAQVVATAVVHDVPEDCPVMYTDEILTIDPVVHRAALQLRNPSIDHPDLERHEKKKMDRDHYLTVDEPLVIIKFKDRLCNVRDTKSWRPKRRANYVFESRLLAGILVSRMRDSQHAAMQHLGVKLYDELLEAIQEIEATLPLANI